MCQLQRRKCELKEIVTFIAILSTYRRFIDSVKNLEAELPLPLMISDCHKCISSLTQYHSTRPRNPSATRCSYHPIICRPFELSEHHC